MNNNPLEGIKPITVTQGPETRSSETSRALTGEGPLYDHLLAMDPKEYEMLEIILSLKGDDPQQVVNVTSYVDDIDALKELLTACGKAPNIAAGKSDAEKIHKILA